MLRYGTKKHTSQDELSAGRNSHGYVKNTVLMSSGVNNPRLNRVGDALLPQAATWAELGKSLKFHSSAGQILKKMME